jgi:hypothetical protein
MDSERLDQIINRIASVEWHKQYITLTMNDAEFLVSVISKTNERLKQKQEVLPEIINDTITPK